MRKIFQWVKDNPNRTMFLVPILLVAGISISHVVSWYDIANPINWAIYLSIAIEVGAMTALVAATNRIKGGVWFMFGLVTLIQMIGNIFFSFKEIDVNGDLFKSWVELTSPLWEMFGSDPTDLISQKRWLAFLEGGLLPIISLTSLHFFTKYDSTKDKLEDSQKEEPISKKTNISEDINDEEYEKMIQEYVSKRIQQQEELRYKPTKEDLDKLNSFLYNIGYSGPKQEENNSEKFAPNNEDLERIQKVLDGYEKQSNIVFEPETIVEEEDEDIEKVFFDNDKVEVDEPLYSDETKIEDNQIEVNHEGHIIELNKPEVVNENKVLNYFKK